jgi:hypothetical protein
MHGNRGVVWPARQSVCISARRTVLANEQVRRILEPDISEQVQAINSTPSIVRARNICNGGNTMKRIGVPATGRHLVNALQKSATRNESRRALNQ